MKLLLRRWGPASIPQKIKPSSVKPDALTIYPQLVWHFGAFRERKAEGGAAGLVASGPFSIFRRLMSDWAALLWRLVSYGIQCHCGDFSDDTSYEE